MLTDDCSQIDEFKEVEQSKVYNFPLTENANATYTLSCLKLGVMYRMLTSNEELPNTDANQNKKSCLAYDTYFKVLKANSAVFIVDKDTEAFIDEEDEKTFEKAYEKKNYVIAVICTSD